MGRGGQHEFTFSSDLYCSPPLEGSQHTVASILGIFHVIMLPFIDYWVIYLGVWSSWCKQDQVLAPRSYVAHVRTRGNLSASLSCDSGTTQKRYSAFQSSGRSSFLQQFLMAAHACQLWLPADRSSHSEHQSGCHNAKEKETAIVLCSALLHFLNLGARWSAQPTLILICRKDPRLHNHNHNHKNKKKKSHTQENPCFIRMKAAQEAAVALLSLV